ncbi:TPA: helix-turn-helix domain-containing protein [Streptococcus suis]
MKVQNISFGQAFKALRISKGYTITQACQDIVSPQFLSKFENDKSSISIENLQQLLLQIGATWQDLNVHYHGPSVENLLIALEQVNALFVAGNYLDGHKLAKQIANKYPTAPHLCHLVSAVGRTSLKDVPHLHSIVEDEEIQQILEYLATIDTWGEFELSIFSFTLTHCPYEMVRYRVRKLLDIVSTKEIPFEKIISYINVFIWAIPYYSKNGYFNEAHYLIRQVEKLLERNDLFYLTHFRIHVMTVKATTLLRQNNLEGLHIAKETLQFYKYCAETFQDSRFNQYRNDIYAILTRIEGITLPDDFI